MESPTVEAQTSPYDHPLPLKADEEISDEVLQSRRTVEISLKYLRKTLSPLQMSKKLTNPSMIFKKKKMRSTTLDNNPDDIGKALLAKAQEISKLLKSQIQGTLTESQTLSRSKSKAFTVHSAAEQLKVSEVLSDRPYVYNNLVGNVEQSQKGRLPKSEFEQFKQKKENLVRKVMISREQGVPTKQLDANLEFRHVQRKNLLLRVQATLDENNIQKILSQNNDEEISTKIPKLNTCKTSSKKFQFQAEEIKKVKSLTHIDDEIYPQPTKDLSRAGTSNCLGAIKNTHAHDLDQYEQVKSQQNSSKPMFRGQSSTVLSPEEGESLPGSVATLKISDILKEKSKKALFRSKTGVANQKLGKLVLSQRIVNENELEKSLQDQKDLESSFTMHNNGPKSYNNFDRKFTMPLHIGSLEYLDEKPALMKKFSQQMSFGYNKENNKLKANEDFRIKLLGNKKKTGEDAPSCPAISSLTSLQEGNLSKNTNDKSEFQTKYNKIWDMSSESQKGNRKKISSSMKKLIPHKEFDSRNGVVFSLQDVEEGYDILMKLDRQAAEPSTGKSTAKNVRLFGHKGSLPEISSLKQFEMAKGV